MDRRGCHSRLCVASGVFWALELLGARDEVKAYDANLNTIALESVRGKLTFWHAYYDQYAFFLESGGKWLWSSRPISRALAPDIKTSLFRV